MIRALLVYKPSHSQERPNFSSVDVRKDTRNGVLSRAFSKKKEIYTYQYMTGRAAFRRKR